MSDMDDQERVAWATMYLIGYSIEKNDIPIQKRWQSGSKEEIKGRKALAELLRARRATPTLLEHLADLFDPDDPCPSVNNHELRVVPRKRGRVRDATRDAVLAFKIAERLRAAGSVERAIAEVHEAYGYGEETLKKIWGRHASVLKPRR